MKLLFICPDWANLASPIVQEMRDQGHKVIHLDSGDLASFRYYSSSHRIMSKILDMFGGKRYKHKRTEEQIYWSLKGLFKGSGRFDAIICTEPNVFNHAHFDLMKRHSDRMVLSLWDSLSRMPQNGTHLDRFDKVFSFESMDCEQHGFIQTYNYIPPVDSTLDDVPQYDVFSVMSFSKSRYQAVARFLDHNPELVPNIYFYLDHPRKRKYATHSKIKVIETLLLEDELSNEIRKSKAILDLGQGQQNGLSFRAYEAIAYGKKLITTSSDIIHYDFYDATNIMVINEPSTKIPDDFFDTDYRSPKSSAIEKYTLKRWVENLIHNLD